MLVPPILPPYEWEAIAAPMQDTLIADSYEDRAQREKLNPEPPIIGRDPADRTDAYKPNSMPHGHFPLFGVMR